MTNKKSKVKALKTLKAIGFDFFGAKIIIEHLNKWWGYIDDGKIISLGYVQAIAFGLWRCGYKPIYLINYTYDDLDEHGWSFFDGEKPLSEKKPSYMMLEKDGKHIILPITEAAWEEYYIDGDSILQYRLKEYLMVKNRTLVRGKY